MILLKYILYVAIMAALLPLWLLGVWSRGKIYWAKNKAEEYEAEMFNA